MQWDNFGDTELYTDDQSKVCGEVSVRVSPNGIKMCHALVNGKFIGKYLNVQHAKTAVEQNQHLMNGKPIGEQS